jgi:hypothetical protein
MEIIVLSRLINNNVVRAHRESIATKGLASPSPSNSCSLCSRDLKKLMLIANRGVVKTRENLVQISGDILAINCINVTVSGTSNLGNGVNVTKLATGSYVVSHPNGNAQFTQKKRYLAVFTITVRNFIFTLLLQYKRILLHGHYHYCRKGETAYRRSLHSIHWAQLARTTTTSLSLQLYAIMYIPCYPFPLPLFVVNLLKGRARNIIEDLFAYNSELAWRAANPLNFTSTNGIFPTNATLLSLALSLCSPLNGTSPLSVACGQYVSNRVDLYQGCLFDVMVGGDSFAGSSIDVYAASCVANAGNGVSVGM